MPTAPPTLPELESVVMDEVWKHEHTTTRDVLDAVNAASAKPRAYTTIMTIMNRLEAKGLLERHRRGKSDVYHAVISRDAYLAARAEAEVDALVDQFGELALTHFAAHMAKLDPKRREQLRRLARRS